MTSKDTGPENQMRPDWRWRSVAIAASLLALAGGAYVIRPHNEPTPQVGTCPINESTMALKPLAQGEVAAFRVADRLQEFPDITFVDTDGKTLTLADFKGKTVLLNLWATWCVPCRHEMPALDKLQADVGGDNFQVVAISLDTGGPDKPKKWLKDNSIRNLAFYGDSKGGVFKTLQKTGHVVGLPTTVLINPDGCQSGILQGGAEWASDDAVKLIRAALGRKE